MLWLYWPAHFTPNEAVRDTPDLKPSDVHRKTSEWLLICLCFSLLCWRWTKEMCVCVKCKTPRGVTVCLRVLCVCVCVVCGGREKTKKHRESLCLLTVGHSRWVSVVELAWTGGGLRPVPGRWKTWLCHQSVHKHSQFGININMNQQTSHTSWKTWKSDKEINDRFSSFILDSYFSIFYCCNC